MPKAYWIAHVAVTNPDPYALYAKGATEAFAKHGARVLARGGAVEYLEGEGHPRNVVITAEPPMRSDSCTGSQIASPKITTVAEVTADAIKAKSAIGIGRPTICPTS